MLASLKRIATLLGGFFLVLAGLFTISLCGEDRARYGALAGALGGLVLALARRRPRALLFTIPGGLLGGLAIALRQQGCEGDMSDYLFPALTSLVIGTGVGLLHDAVRAGKEAQVPTRPSA